MPQSCEIEHEVERLYLVFGRYDCEADMETCPCRGPETVRPLFGRPLRQLTPGDLHFYAFCAMTTMGDVDDFKHFLPRILELLLEENFLALVDREVVLGKLRYGNWESWPADEQEAIRQYLQAVWRLHLNSPPPEIECVYPPVAEWLCAIARAEVDLGGYLEEWNENNSPAAKANLSRFISTHCDELCTGQAPIGYWENAVDQWRQVADWIRSQEPLDPPSRTTEPRDSV